jgi:ribulose-5-phosphate 4-epimerase/fuculose-1-phosphate aldolase
VTKTEKVKELKRKVALSCRMMGSGGVTKGAFGHVSARIPGTDRILIKSKGPSEAPLEFATEKDIITIDLKGKVLEASKGLEAPQETEMHLVVYKARPEVMSVIHTHPDWVVVLTACEKPLVPLYAAYNPPSMRLVLEGIPLYPRSVTIVNEALAEDFIKVMGDKKACLLLGHGMTTAGKSVEEATAISLNVYELARMNYLAYAIGNPKPVPEEDLLEYKRRWERGLRRTLEEQEPTAWRAHKRLLEKR